MNIGSRLRGFNSFPFLNIVFAGTGSGTVTRTPPDLACSDECNATYIKGSTVSLLAAPSENSVFAGWSGDVQGGELACSVFMDAAKKVVANFSLIARQEKRIGPFVDNCDGTVTDTRTGLMWIRFVEGQDYLGQAKGFTFDQANAMSRDFAGYNDWRLPTIDELQTIIEKSRSNPAFDPAVFPRFERINPNFWASSVSQDSPTGLEEPLYVSFYSGSVFRGHPNTANSVRLVRKVNPPKEEISGADTKLSEIASQRIAPENATEWSGTGFEYLLREVERADEPSANLIKALTKKPEIVSRSIGRLNRTLLHHAAAHQKLETVKYLCQECHADINSVDKDGETPLDYALAVKASAIVDFLRAYGGKSRKDVIEINPDPDQLVNESALIQVEKRQVSPEQQSIIEKSEVSRFLDNGDGTVLDTETGLTWMRFSEGQTWSSYGSSSGLAKLMYIHEAKTMRKQFSGFDDWRLPSIVELKTLLAVVDQQNPAIDSAAFPNTPPSNYWSSSVDDGNWLLGVNFLDGKTLGYGPSNKNHVRFVRRGFTLVVNTDGLGEGFVSVSPLKNSYALGSSVEIKAIPRLGSVFSRWSGDIASDLSTCRLQIDEDKHLVAHFEKRSFTLLVEQIGTGSGVVSRNDESSNEVIDSQKAYPAGTSLTLIATPNLDSIFAGWSGSASNAEVSLSLVMDAEKSVSANFQLKSFELTLSREGAGSGEVVCTPAGSCYDIGTQLTLTAKANPGSSFSGWTGDVIQNELTCAFVMDSAMVVTANFSRIAYALDVLKAGSGTGTVTRNLLSESYFYGDTVTLTATAAKGSIFSGWAGAATGIDATQSFVFDADKTLIASFNRLNISNFDITVDFVSAEHASMKTGDDAFILYLSIANQGQKQVRMALPLVSYVTHAGEEIQQDAWLTGLIIGNEGATLRAGAFRKAGLVFFKSKLAEISAGDQFHVSISQSTPALRFDFSFKCTDSKSRSFTLIDAAVEAIHVPLEIPASTLDASAILHRLELLETGLSDVLFRLAKLEAAPPELIKNTENIALTVTSLSQVLAWLVTQERVPIAGLRERLLPLDQFPGAFIDEINEKALDLVGDLALEEFGDEVIVTKDVCFKVIENLE